MLSSPLYFYPISMSLLSFGGRGSDWDPADEVDDSNGLTTLGDAKDDDEEEKEEEKAEEAATLEVEGEESPVEKVVEEEEEEEVDELKALERLEKKLKENEMEIDVGTEEEI